MKILVINAGSSSLKYQLFNMDNGDVLAKGLCERIGVDGALKHSTIDGKKLEIEHPLPDHDAAITLVIDTLTKGDYAVLSDVSELDAIGQRIAHGGKFKKSTLLDDEAMEGLEPTKKLAPLHNPPVIKVIDACKKIVKGVPQVAVFDTSFYADMPMYNYVYPLPYEYYEEHQIRKYGFHGTSHRYVSQKAADFLGKDIKDLKIVSCHLGSGSSITAVDGGKAVNTTMGFTPLDGLIMGTRCGSVDPAVMSYMVNDLGMDCKDVINMMNKSSGFHGLTGGLSDLRDVGKAAREGNERAKLALEILYHQVRRYIGSYSADMNGLDVVIFTAGVGENDFNTRENATNDMTFFGIEIDKELNKNCPRDQVVDISGPNSKVKVLVIPTNEEYMIAQDTMKVINEK